MTVTATDWCASGEWGPVRSRFIGDRLNQLPQAFVLADGDGEADTHLAADGDESVGVEAAVGAHRELAAGPTVAHTPHRFTQEVGSAASGVGTALAQPGHQHVAGSGGDGQQWVIAPRAGVVVVSRPFFVQSMAETGGPVSTTATVRFQHDLDTRLTSTRSPGRSPAALAEALQAQRAPGGVKLNDRYQQILEGMMKQREQAKSACARRRTSSGHDKIKDGPAELPQIVVIQDASDPSRRRRIG